MLELLRAFAKTWVAKILLAVLIVSFGAFGINNVIQNLGSSTVARVGGTDITSQDFQRAYQQQLNTVAQQTGKMPNSTEALAMGIPSQVVTGLAANAAINTFAQSMGIGTSDDRLSTMLRSNTAFQGASGTFDKQVFAEVLQQNGFTETQYLDEQAKQSRSLQLQDGLFADAPVPKTALDLLHRYTSDTRTLNYVVLNATNIPTVPAPTDAELTAYLKAHQKDYRTEETRTVDVMLISPGQLASGITVSPDQIAAQYAKSKTQLTKPEKRDIQQVVLTDAQAKTFADGKAAGKSFGDLVKQTGASVTDLGLLSKDAVTDSSLADAAFGLKQTGDFVIIPGIGGQRAVSVSKIDPGGVETLAEATPRIKDQLAQQQAANDIGNDVDQIEDLRAADKPLSDIAPRYKLKVTPLTLTADGAALSAVPGLAEADRAKVAQEIFKAKAGGITPSIQISGSGTLWFDLKKVDPARDQTLAEVHDAVAKAWTSEKTDAAYKAEAAKLMADFKAGKSFDQVAASLNQVPTLSQPITRQGATSPGSPADVLNADVANAAFSAGLGHYGYAVDGDGDYVVFQVAGINPASGQLNPQVIASLDDSMHNSLFGNFVQGLIRDQGIRTNQQVLDQLLAVGQQGQ